MRSDI